MRKTIRELIVGLIITIVGGIVVAWYIQEGQRFQPPPTATPTPPMAKTPTYLAYPIQLTTVHSGGATWSWDGSRIAYFQWSDNFSRDIWTMNPDGSSKVRLTSSGVNEAPTFSPDGKKIIFSRWGLRGDIFDLFVMNADGSNVTRLTSSGGSYNRPNWSPDGQKVFLDYDDGDHFYVAVINPDGTGLTKLAEGYHPRLSYDGTKIVYISANAPHEIWIMNNNGSNRRQLTSGYDDSHPDLSPDRSKIAFSRNGDLYVMNLDSSFLTQLTVGEWDDREPRWSPDNTRIAFTSGRTGTATICLLTAVPVR